LVCRPDLVRASVQHRGRRSRRPEAGMPDTHRLGRDVELAGDLSLSHAGGEQPGGAQPTSSRRPRSSVPQGGEGQSACPDAHLPQVAKVLCIDLASLDLPAASVDLVVSNVALHHLTNAEKQALVQRARRWLWPGGRIIIAGTMFGWGAPKRTEPLRCSGSGHYSRPVLSRFVMKISRRRLGLRSDASSTVHLRSPGARCDLVVRGPMRPSVALPVPSLEGGLIPAPAPTPQPPSRGSPRWPRCGVPGS
jgi:hypothetical protein